MITANLSYGILIYIPYYERYKYYSYYTVDSVYLNVFKKI